MLLTADIGNTNITLGAFDGEALLASWRLSTDARRQPDEYAAILRAILPMRNVTPEAIDSAIICSVVPPLTAVFEDVCKSGFGVTPLVVGTGIRTGVRILYDSPRDVGADRIVDAAAAYRLYGGPIIVVDFGTATVFDAVTGEGEYLGGALFPGINLAAEALFLGTSQLRRVELSPPRTAIGRNTVAALQSGLVFGHVAMVEGMVKRFKDELSPGAKVIATGGLAPLIATETQVFHAVNPDLTLVGLRMIHEMNQ